MPGSRQSGNVQGIRVVEQEPSKSGIKGFVIKQIGTHRKERKIKPYQEFT